MHNQLRGCVKINASGRNLYGFINRIHSERICCFGQYCRKDVFYADIYRHDLKRIIALAEECGVELKYHELETLSSKLLRYRRRFGIAVGVVIAAAASLYFSGIVLTIEIQGNSSVSDSVILAALDELDIRQGSFLRDINFHYCEDELRLMVDGISWAAIRHTGNRVVVEVTEIVPKPEMLAERMPCNVVAGKTAQITGTIVRDGMLMRIVGDYVRAGDLLISGVVEDTTGHVTKHHAMGDITGIYEETAVFTAECETEQFTPTGEASDERYLRLFNLKIPLFIGRNDYESFSSEQTERQLTFFGKNLPIWIIKDSVSETKRSVITHTDEELDMLLMDKIYLYEKNFIDNEVEILSREIKSEKKENSLTYTVAYTLEGEIGVQKEIFIK